VQSSVQQQIVNRDLLDNLPSGRQMWNIGATLPGIVASGQDVGGAAGIQQIRITAHGSDAFQTVTQVDGMELNTMGANGSAVPYFNDGMAQEMTFQTSAMRPPGRPSFPRSTTMGRTRPRISPDRAERRDGVTCAICSRGPICSAHPESRLLTTSRSEQASASSPAAVIRR
jgi:hypothetical protein